MSREVSTGMPGIDRAIDKLRLGDNVVWQVDTLSDYRKIVEPYVRQAMADGRELYYIRFGTHDPVIRNLEGIRVCEVDASRGFEYFATKIHRIIEKAGLEAFYIFDCLTDLLKYWYSDLMIGNFFRVTCPYLFELDTIAYFALIRDSHTTETISRIRDTTQVLLDLYNESGNYYVHPLKVWERYSPTMFFPHKLVGDEAECISASFDASVLFGRFTLNTGRLDYWDITFEEANRALAGSTEEKEKYKDLLLELLLGKESRMLNLCRHYFSLRDLLNIKRREIGTGMIGGKSIGMLLARKILERDPKKRFAPILEMHDSFYMGVDVYYTYIVLNNCWTLRTKQKTEEGYYKYADELRERLLTGEFSEAMKEQFRQVLEYYGQSPIIVRSSSLLEDNFGNAFAGKYDSVFCANQGTPEERLADFIHAVQQVYASTMNRDALQYRQDRGLMDRDEQMALLIQRVSGDHYGDFFFPHMAGVGNSANLYVWDEHTDVNAGMLRLVFGLGTRAVDRIDGDYPRIVNLDDPCREPLISNGDERKFSQHYMDLINTKLNAWSHYSIDRMMETDMHMDKSLFVRKDWNTSKRKRELGIPGDAYIVDFQKLLRETNFADMMKAILKRLSGAYDYPVDIEFCVNFDEKNNYRINLLQCRPLQTRGLGKTVEMPDEKNVKYCLMSTRGNFMGGNVHYKVDYIVYVKVREYLKLSEQDRYGVARQIGELNRNLKGKHAILIGHGRWGTTTTSLGVPVNFTELMHMQAIFEVSYTEGHLMPELSYGSHFFQDLVESGVFYGAVFDGDENVHFDGEYLRSQENHMQEFSDGRYSEVIQVIRSEGMELYSDTVTQKMMCVIV
ncbi:MAG: PEP/pyruvate-binding domain-containing protein [Eubacteriales bacterium]|nr:PEP/pyruvate-binding domain-containing protein [Eubacteriales bacterium]